MHMRVPGNEFSCLSVAMRVSCYAYQNICSSDPMHKCIWPYAIFLIRDSVIMSHGPGCARARMPGAPAVEKIFFLNVDIQIYLIYMGPITLTKEKK